MPDIPAPLPWEKRSKSISTMPGKGTEFMNVLMKVSIQIKENQQLSPGRLADWLEEVTPRNNEFSLKFVKFLLNAGIVEQGDNGTLQLSELMNRYTETKDNSIPISIIHRRIRFIGEVLAELERPKTIRELCEIAVRKYEFNWKGENQVTRRCKWLMSAEMIAPQNGSNRLDKDTPLGLTRPGCDLLNLLEIYEPDVAIFDYDELERKTKEEREKIRKNPSLPPPVGVAQPQKKEQTIIQYSRCEKIRGWVLERSDDTCELCSNKAPFVKEDGTPFLEVHHIVQLSQGGPDTLENTVALCPNCHRHLHYGKDRKKKEQELQKNIKHRNFSS